MIEEPRDVPTLRVNGRQLTGWKTARISRQIEAFAGSFEMTALMPLVGEKNRRGALPVSHGDVCSVMLGEQEDAAELISGAIDSVSMSLESLEFSITGRDRAGVLVDCSAAAGLKLGPFEYREIPMLILARQLCAPFGIIVTAQEGLTLPVISKFAVDPGETVFDALSNLCRTAGVLAVSDGSGGLILTRAGAKRCSALLEAGRNLLNANVTFDATKRFRRYVVLAQQNGRDEVAGAQAAGVKGEAQDQGVRSDRVLVLRPQGVHSAQQARDRAQWEATTRAAQGFSMSVSVQGWRQPNGSPWPINALVQVRAPQLQLGKEPIELLITSVTYSLDVGAGSTTALELVRPDAYSPEPVIKATPAGGPKSKPWDALKDGV